MRNDRESSEVDGLLNALLADEDWRALNSALKREALAAIGVTRQRRRLRIWLGQATCVVALLVGAAWWLDPSAPNAVPGAGTFPSPVSANITEKFISEEEMLATFPEGSCVVAEIDGQKRLVFFDAKQAEEGFAWSRQ